MNSTYLRVVILAQENAAPGKWEWTQENLLGLVCTVGIVLFYLGMMYLGLFKSHESNRPKMFFGCGLILGSPLIGGAFGGGLGFLVGILFGNGQAGAALGAGIGIWVVLIVGILFFLVSLCVSVRVD